MEYNPEYNNEYNNDFIEQEMEEFNKVLMGLVNEGLISMSVNVDGEFVFFMTDHQKEKSL